MCNSRVDRAIGLHVQRMYRQSYRRACATHKWTELSACMCNACVKRDIGVHVQRTSDGAIDVHVCATHEWAELSACMCNACVNKAIGVHVQRMCGQSYRRASRKQ